MSSFFHINNTTELQKKQEKISKKLEKLEEKYKIKASLEPIIAGKLTQAAKEAYSKCGEYITIDENGYITQSCFCRSRYCPICNYVASEAKYAQIINTIQTLPYNFIFVTATVKNCNVNDLEKTLVSLSSAFKRYANRKPMKGISKGYFRATEITYNAKTNTFHPHIHMLVAVPEEYYTSSLYTSTYEWRVAWESAARLNYTCQFDVQAIADNENMYKAVAEISKYVLKMTDVLYCGNDEVVETLIKATKGKRMINTAGCFRELAKEKYEHEKTGEQTGYQIKNGKYTVLWKEHNGRIYMNE